MNEKAIRLSDPRVIIAGIRHFGLASDGSDLRDLEAAFERLTAALPPLRAREEIARLIEKLRNSDDLSDQQITFACAEAADALARTAGQEWRDISAPDGWQLVPKVPTQAMLEAVRGSQYWSRPAIYSAMLSAAPPVAEPIVAEKREPHE